MERDVTRIAHLSDPHFSPQNRDASFYRAVQNDLIELQPTIIVVTGDIADNMDLSKSDFMESLNAGKEFLEALCKKCNCDPNENLFVVPGNHDYRFAGLIKKKYYPTTFSEVFGKYFQTKYIRGAHLIVGCFDSNTTEREVNLATGEVLRSEFNRFDEDMKELEKKLGEEFYTTQRIALLHHHPMPIQRAEGESGLSNREEFLLLRNGGTFIREMIKNNVALIFNGHKHSRGTSKASFPIGESRFRNVGVISAASIGKETGHEYSYNIVDMFGNGQVTVDFRVLRGQGTYDSANGKPLELFDDREIRLFSFENGILQTPFVAKRYIYSSRIRPLTGNQESHTVIEDRVSTRGPVNEREIEFYSDSGIFSEWPQYTVLRPASHKIELKLLGSPINGKQKALASFAPPLDRTPISTDYILHIPNAFSFTKEERLAVSQGKSDCEELSCNLENHSAERLIMGIEFPPDSKPINPRVEVRHLNDIVDSKEQEYCNGCFSYSELLNCAFLSVDFPPAKRLYTIIWELPYEDDIRGEIGSCELAKAEKMRNILLSLKPDNSYKADVRKSLEEIYYGIKSFKDLGPTSSYDPFEVSLLAFDKKHWGLRYVAQYCPKNETLPESPIWNCKIMIGHPYSGLAFKRKEVAFKFFPTQPHDAIRAYLRSPACASPVGHYFTAIVAVPLFYPPETKNIVGVMELSSCSHSSCLLRLDGVNDQEKAKKIEAAAIYVQNRFCKFSWLN